MSAVLAPVRDARPWRQFICRACGYIYDEEDGDPDGGLAPGTRYEDIPDDWACPLCGVSKRDFDPYEAAAATPRSTSVAVRLPSVARAQRGVVIVGGGLAGWSVARALRAKDPDLPITLVAADSADVYSKPGLSLAFGQLALGHRKSPDDLIATRASDAARDLAVRLVGHAHVVAVDAPRRRVRTTRGTIAYDRLILAVGARPVDATTLPADLCWRINSLDAWMRLHATLAGRVARIAIVGAGLVGCEMADDLAHAGHEVTVFDPAPRPLAAWATVDEAQRLLDGWVRLGVRFVSTAIRRMERRSIDGRPVVVIHRADDDHHDADIVIAAIGLRLDPRLARSAGLVVDAGIAVDAQTMTTSDPAIHALGDCVSIDGKPCRFIEPIARQAEAIAAAIVGSPIDGPVVKAPLVRLKTRSAPMTLGASAASR